MVPDFRHPGEGRDLDEAYAFSDEIPAFAGMTMTRKISRSPPHAAPEPAPGGR
jgi:hypothetical protein